MKKIVTFIAVITMAMYAQMPMQNGGLKMPKNFRAVPISKAQIVQDGPAKFFCVKCGMSLPMFYKTNHAAKVDGKMEQFCSIYCLVEEIKSGKKVEDIQVVDNTTLKFIPVSRAWYVVGSSKPATMAKKVSKYAFGTKDAAQKFAKEFGGKVVKFDDALKIAKADFDSDTKAKKIRQDKMRKIGKEVYTNSCKKIDKKFNTPAEAKAYIVKNRSCANLKGKALQAVGLYLTK